MVSWLEYKTEVIGEGVSHVLLSLINNTRTIYTLENNCELSMQYIIKTRILSFKITDIMLIFFTIWYVGPQFIRIMTLAQLEPMMKAHWRQSMALKWKHVPLPKPYKHTCYGDHNMLCDGEQAKKCHNRGNAIIRGDPQSDSIWDGRFLYEWWSFYNENTNILRK